MYTDRLVCVCVCIYMYFTSASTQIYIKAVKTTPRTKCQIYT